jgi:hypothetical protein
VSAGGAPESWEQWTARIAGELTDLTEGEWLTITAAPEGSAGGSGGASASPGGPLPYAGGSPERGRRWSLRRGSTTPANAGGPVADVFLQARLLEGVLALECISDTEFEGLSDLSTEQEQALVALGWEQRGHEPAFERTYPLDAESSDPAASTEAAHLLRQSLEQVLGARTPAEIVLRRSTRDPSAG